MLTVLRRIPVRPERVAITNATVGTVDHNFDPFLARQFPPAIGRLGLRLVPRARSFRPLATNLPPTVGVRSYVVVLTHVDPLHQRD